MASTGIIFAALAIVIVIIFGALAGIFYFKPGNNGRTTSSSSTFSSSTGSSTGPGTQTSSISSTSPSSSSTSTLPLIVTSTITSTKTGTGVSTVTQTLTSTNTNTTTHYSLQLLRPGSGPLVYSPLTTPSGIRYLPYDGPCCTEPVVYGGEINYSDQGNTWTIQGDIEPGSAWVFANSSGLTITYDGSQGGPMHEAQGDNEAFNDISIYGDLQGGLPANATVFSIDAYIPYHSYYANCQRDYGKGGNGCVYELTPYDGAALAYDVGGNLVVVSIAEVCNFPCSSNALQMSAFTSLGGSSIEKTLATITNPVFTPYHRLTIATDRKTYIDFYVDNTLLYSNSTMPIDLGGGGYSLQISQRTSINNETSSVTWSNAAVYESSSVSVSGLARGMSLFVKGSGGFNETVPANSTSGFASANVAREPANLTVSIESNGKTILTYATTVKIGAEFRFVINTTTSTLSQTYSTIYTTTYTTTNVTTYTTTTR